MMIKLLTNCGQRRSVGNKGLSDAPYLGCIYGEDMKDVYNKKDLHVKSCFIAHVIITFYSFIA